MATRGSGRVRRKNELYETPPWVVLDGLAPHLDLRGKVVREVACGNGRAVESLAAAGAIVFPSDRVRHPRYLDNRRKVPALGWLPSVAKFRLVDFLRDELPELDDQTDIIATNPPYGVQGALACQFIVRGLEYLRRGRVKTLALLLPIDFDSAKTRRSLFELCPEFRTTIVLTDRIEWFPRAVKADGTLSSGPSVNHGWFIWTAKKRRAGEHPVKLYAGKR